MKLFKNTYFLLALILVFAFVVRTINLKDNILFAYDQARDAQRIYNMVYKGDIKIVGPETDIQGIFNGPLLYYMLAPVYALSGFDPNAAALLFVFINVATVALVFWAAKLLFQKNSVALLSALLFATSYEQGFFARYISNASPMSTATTLFFIGLAAYFLRKKEWGLPLSALGIALAIHSNFYFIYLFLFYPLFFFLFKNKLKIKTVGLTFLILILLLSPWIITELRWKFVGTRSLLGYFFSPKSTAETSAFFVRYYERVSNAIYLSFIPHKAFGFASVFVAMIYLLFKKKSPSLIFLALWTLNTLPLFFFKSGVQSVEVINGSIFVPLTILVAYGTTVLPSILPSIVTLGIVSYGLFSYIHNSFVPTSVMTGIPSLLKYSKQSIDYTYQKAQKKEFALCSISEPLFMNTVWGFLYSTYGKQKYGYVPAWSGQAQTMNESFIPYAHKKYNTKFIIQEPLYGIPAFAPRATYYIEDTYNTLKEKRQFGTYSVRMRVKAITPPDTNEKRYTREQRASIEEDIEKVPQFSCDIIHGL